MNKAWFLITCLTVAAVVIVVLVFTERMVRRVAGRGVIGQDKTAIGDGW